MLTKAGKKTIGSLTAGDILYRLNPMTQQFEKYSVFLVRNHAETVEEVYNIATTQGNYLINDIVVLEK